MFKIQEVLPFLVVAIMGVWVGTMSLADRPSPADIARIHNGMEDQRDIRLPKFVAMGFSGEVKSNEMKFRKYPLPDERYFSRLELTSFQGGDSTMTIPMQDTYYDFTNRADALFITGRKGRDIEAGYTIIKAQGDSTFSVMDGKEEVMKLELDWRLFIPDSLYAD